MSFRFDTGPSLLLLPQQYRDAFAAIGKWIASFIASLTLLQLCI
jgi:phytoene dehydrogenase-like protein